MLEVFEIAEDSYRLLDGRGRDVGWIRGGALGFGGFRTEADALTAAAVGHQALAAHLRRSFGAPMLSSDPGAPLRVVHDGADDWISRGAQPLARLFRPGEARRADGHDATYRVEFVVPSYVRAGALIAAAQQLHRAIQAPASPTNAGAASGERTSAAGPALDAR
ncbi:MAG TPA: hypothetical protein VFZ11_13855 [Gemmatimonadaceae bacterium]